MISTIFLMFNASNYITRPDHLDKFMMKYLASFMLCTLTCAPLVLAQTTKNTAEDEITYLIDLYAQARESSDTILLQSILTEDIDQLVSSGDWRKGLEEALKGMQQSTAVNPGSRVLKVENIRFLNPEAAIADARYEIRNADGSLRKMWSTFVVVREENGWKITAIRNMLPAK